MRRWLCLILLAGAVHQGRAATLLTVPFQKTVTHPVEGLTAAYSIDPSIMEASADGGMLVMVGKAPGTTHVVAITSKGFEEFEVTVANPIANKQTLALLESVNLAKNGQM